LKWPSSSNPICFASIRPCAVNWSIKSTAATGLRRAFEKAIRCYSGANCSVTFVGAHQREWARRKRVEIFKALDTVCVGYKKKCGRTKHLQLDCIIPANNGHGKWSYDTRVRFYLEQLKKGNLQVLCSKCHEHKSRDEQIANGNMTLNFDNEPF